MKYSYLVSSFSCQPLELVQWLDDTYFTIPYGFKAFHSNSRDKGHFGLKDFSLLNSCKHDLLIISSMHIMKLIISMEILLFCNNWNCFNHSSNQNSCASIVFHLTHVSSLFLTQYHDWFPGLTMSTIIFNDLIFLIF